MIGPVDDPENSIALAQTGVLNARGRAGGESAPADVNWHEFFDYEVETCRLTRSDKNLLVIFLHIPKTGGTTLWSVLYRQYGQKHSRRITEGSIAKNAAMLRSLIEQDSSKFGLLGGHVPYGVHTSTQRSTSYFTLLRDPVQWLFSSYYKVLRKQEHPLHEKFTAEKTELNDGIVLLEDNLQTRMLAGLDDTGTCTSEHLEIAKQTLRDRIDTFGLLERYDESLVVFRRFYGWKTPLYVRKNVGTNTRAKTQHTAESVEIAQAHNALDVQLYAFAAALFEERLREQGRGFQREAAIFPRLNALYGRWVNLTGRR